MAKKNTPSDAEVEALLARMSVPVALASPSEITFAPEEDPAPTQSAPPADPNEEERPIKILLPVREDPTHIEVMKGVSAVQPVDMNGNLPDDPAARIATEIQTHNVAALNGAHAAPEVEQALGTIHATTPITVVETIPENPLEALSEVIREVITQARVTVWPVHDDPAKPYWSARQGPRAVGIPWNASIDEWRQRLSSISV